MFIDAEYGADDDGRVTTGEITLPFLTFAREVASHAGGLSLLGRAAPRDAQGMHRLDGVTAVSTVPGYPRLTELGAVARSLPGALRVTWRWVGDNRVVWLFGPHPLALAAALFGVLRGRRVVLGVRQDTIRYFRSRLPSRRWLPVLLPIFVLDTAFRAIGRILPVTAVGPELARQYGHPRRNVLPMTVALTAAADLADGPLPRDGGPLRLLTVGRLAPEKSPTVLVEALAEVRRRTGHPWRASWVGSGPLVAEVAAAAVRHGVGDALTLEGYVPFGPDLVSRYRSAHVFVHTAVTEGVPQVLVEAMAAGCAIVATDVGGVASLLQGGRLGLLVPPGDPAALAEAVVSLLEDEPARAALGQAALDAARAMTREAEGARVARFVLDHA